MTVDDKLELGQDQQKAWEQNADKATMPFQDYEFKTPWRFEDGEYTVTRTTAWTAPGCHEGCGLLVYSDKDGKLVKVEGDPESPFSQGRLCPRCFAVGDVMYHKDRVIYPMKRDKSQRGNADAWERCTWDEALDICEREFKKIIENYGPEYIQGWRGTGRDDAWQTGRLLYAMGSPNECGLESGISCYLPRLSQMIMTCGGQMLADYSQGFVDRYDYEEFEIPNCIIVWGCNPLVSNPDFQLGHWVTDCMKLGSKLIVVDPRLTWTAAHADLHLQIRPGTDGALAFGMDYVLIEEDLIDHGFIDRWTYGFEDFKEVVMEWPPERAAETCWIDADDIRKAARMFAEKKPANCFWGVAVDMQGSGIGAAMAIQALWIMTGNVDNPGGMMFTQMPFGITQCQGGGWGIRDLPMETQVKRHGYKEYPMYRFGLTYTQPDQTLINSERGEVKGIIIQTSNVFTGMSQEPVRWYNVAKNVDFVLAIDIFVNPTIQACADVFLPAACWPEKQGFRAWDYDVSTINPCCKPVGEVKSDTEICRLLGQRFSKDHFWPWETEEQVYDEVLKTTGMTWEQLRDHGPAYPAFEYYKYEKGLLRPDGKPGFNTPTGRLEFRSTLFEEFGLPALAHFKEPSQSPVSTPELYEEYPIILMTGARSPVFFHTEHRQIPHLRQFDKEPTVSISAEDAKRIGVTEGDWVWIENTRGKCRQRAHITGEIRQGTALARHGWWFPEKEGTSEASEPSLYGMWDVNVNKLIGNNPSVYGFGADIRCLLCKIYPVKDGEM